MSDDRIYTQAQMDEAIRNAFDAARMTTTDSYDGGDYVYEALEDYLTHLNSLSK